MTTKTLTIDQLISWYAEDIAFAAEAQPATTPQDFVSQLKTAAFNLGHYARLNGADDLDLAATYLSYAIEAAGGEQHIFVKRAAGYLKDTDNLVGEYRLMV